MRKNIPGSGLPRKLRSWLAGIILGIGSPAAAADPVFASPLPPGPGQVPLVSGPLVAPILMPLSSPTAAPVGVFPFGPSQPTMTIGDAAATESSFGTAGVSSTQSRRRVWATADFFYGFGQGTIVPPLATASPAGTPPGQAGVIGFPATAVAFGDRRVANDFRPGLRIGLGFWFDDCRTRGLDFNYWFLGNLNREFAGLQPDPAGVQLFTPATLNGVNLAGAVGLAPNGILANVGTATYGFDGNYRRSLGGDGSRRLELLFGARYFWLADDVRQTAIADAGGPGIPFPFSVVRDSAFLTRNAFYGGQIGLIAGHTFASGFSLQFTAKCALGVTHTQADVVGASTALVPAGPLPSGPGTFLVQPGANAGRFVDDSFGVVPEAGLRLGYDCGERLRLTAGYNVLYWNRVQRAADQIRLNLIGTQPPFPAATTDFWVQGWTMGLDVRF